MTLYYLVLFVDKSHFYSAKKVHLTYAYDYKLKIQLTYYNFKIFRHICFVKCTKKIF